MINKIFKTPDTWEPFVLRVLLGLVIFPHGAQKLFGWFEGYGFDGTMIFFTEIVGMPWVLGFLVILLEALGSIVLLAGFATRILAASYILLAIVIVTTSHLQHGFFMNWYGNQPGEGIEFFILWVAISTALLLSGGGRYSVDKCLSGVLPEQAHSF
ncbi:DoxX family protein [uncultured Imperialibacter sp.]|uniref:DoxX family protein n=1 Tax=uncultured Imperialibacter sp. TaxID=1672639 RepID=UPI0030DB44C7|tara:strand:+ start:21235 stop:21702 length:468 start_codon:yes stop_codon:yes gene_type:complete